MIAFIDHYQIHLISGDDALIYNLYEMDNIFYMKLINGLRYEAALPENEVYVLVPKVCRLVDIVTFFSQVGSFFSMRLLVTSCFYSFDLCTITYRSLQASRRCIFCLNHGLITTIYGHNMSVFVRGFSNNSHLIIGPLKPSVSFAHLKDAVERHMDSGLIRLTIMNIGLNPFEGAALCVYRNGFMATRALVDNSPWMVINNQAVFIYRAEPLLDSNVLRNLVIKQYPIDVNNTEFLDLLLARNIDLRNVYSFEKRGPPFNEAIITFTKPIHCFRAFAMLKNSRMRGNCIVLTKRTDLDMFYNSFIDQFAKQNSID